MACTTVMINGGSRNFENEGEPKTVYQSPLYLSQMHTMNYTCFTREKSDVSTEKNGEANREGRAATECAAPAVFEQ